MPLFRPRTPLSSSSPHQPCSPMSSPWPSPLLWSKLWHLLLRLLSYKSIVAPDHVLAYHALMTPSILRMKCDTLCPPGLCHCLPTTVSSHQSLGHTGLNHTGIPWLSCTLSRPHAFVPRASCSLQVVKDYKNSNLLNENILVDLNVQCWDFYDTPQISHPTSSP